MIKIESMHIVETIKEFWDMTELEKELLGKHDGAEQMLAVGSSLCIFDSSKAKIVRKGSLLVIRKGSLFAVEEALTHT